LPSACGVSTRKESSVPPAQHSAKS
jgi:hypothetical protein